jgi:hypothetical protein
MAKARKNKKRNLLPWLIIGAGAVYLLTRKKAGAQPLETGEDLSGGGAGSGGGGGGGGAFPDYRGYPGGTWAIINNNPQNLIFTGWPWKGKSAVKVSPYEQFSNMYYGWRAAIENANFQVPKTDATTGLKGRNVEGLLKILHLGSLPYTTAAKQANLWIISEMQKGGADTSVPLVTIQEAGKNYDVNYWWLFHRNNARLEAGTKFTDLIDNSKGAFVAAFNDVVNENT